MLSYHKDTKRGQWCRRPEADGSPWSTLERQRSQCAPQESIDLKCWARGRLEKGSTLLLDPFLQNKYYTKSMTIGSGALFSWLGSKDMCRHFCVPTAISLLLFCPGLQHLGCYWSSLTLQETWLAKGHMELMFKVKCSVWHTKLLSAASIFWVH